MASDSFELRTLGELGMVMCRRPVPILAEPMFVFGVSGEQVVVNIDLSAFSLESIGNRLLP